MSCNCKQMKGFDLTMFKAKSYEKRTKRPTAVFIVNKEKGIISFTELANIDKVEGICCYFTTDGVEHQIKKAKKSSPPKAPSARSIKGTKK